MLALKARIPSMQNTGESNNRSSFVARDVSTGRSECWLRVESMSLPLCQPVWSLAQGNLRRSLCFGWLSSSGSLVILWSCQAPCSLPHSLSPLMGLTGEKTLSAWCQSSIPFTSTVYPQRGHFNHHLPALSSRFLVRWQKKSWFFPDTSRDFSIMGPHFMYFQWYFFNQDWGQHLWIAHHTAVQGCQNVSIPI